MGKLLQRNFGFTMQVHDTRHKSQFLRKQRFRLRRLLAQQAQTVADEALRTQGEIQPDELEKLEQLTRLVRIYDSPPLQPQRRWWPAAAVFFGSFLFVSILLFARVPKTEVVLKATVSEFCFELAKNQVITDLIGLRSLGASDLEEIRLPRSRTKPNHTISAQGSNLAMSVSGCSKEKEQGKVSLAPLRLPSGSVVRVVHLETPYRYQMSIERAKFELQANVNGPTRIGFSKGPTELRNFKSPRPLVLIPRSKDVDVFLETLGKKQGFFLWSDISAEPTVFHHGGTRRFARHYHPTIVDCPVGYSIHGRA
jgi:hypothetical protein